MCATGTWKRCAGRSRSSSRISSFSRARIAENIAFGKTGAQPGGNCRGSCQAAQADEFIESFDEGYQTVIGERGVTLSGGQRQRLALARAFLTDPRILILDDSTSAIDSATEDKIQRAIYAAAKGRTTFIITHRLSQIRWADLIMVLAQGARSPPSGSTMICCTRPKHTGGFLTINKGHPKWASFPD